MIIEPGVLDEKLAANEHLLIFDVRSKFEYALGHLPGAVNFPFWKVPFLLSQLPTDKEILIVLYCEHGPRAVLAKRILNLIGYDNTFLLKGHMQRWRRENRDMVQ